MSTHRIETDEDKDLMGTFARRVNAGIGSWYGPASRLITNTAEIRCYKNSFVLRYKLATRAGNKGVLVKIRRNPKMTSLTQAVHASELHANIPKEYNTLRYVYERIGSGHAHFSAIRPLDYWEDCFAIVMEEFPSRSLRQLLQKERHKRNGKVEAIARRSGELLRFFHQSVYSTEPCPYSVVDILADAETYALALEQHSGGRVRAQEILDAFGWKLSKMDIRSIAYTSAHQDLTCDNVLYSDAGKVCLIDIKVKPAPLYSDLGLLLIHPHTFRDQIFRDGKYFSPEYLQSYRDSILKGYFTGSSIDENLINIYAAIRVLDKWTMHQELLYRYKGLKRVLTRPLSPLVSGYFQRLWKSYLQMVV